MTAFDYTLDPDLPEQLEAVAHMAAAGIADILYEALHEIQLHRGLKDA